MDPASWCDGCNELKPTSQMAFTEVGLYRCALCRGVKEEVSPQKEHWERRQAEKKTTRDRVKPTLDQKKAIINEWLESRLHQSCGEVNAHGTTPGGNEDRLRIQHEWGWAIEFPKEHHIDFSAYLPPGVYTETGVGKPGPVFQAEQTLSTYDMMTQIVSQIASLASRDLAEQRLADAKRQGCTHYDKVHGVFHSPDHPAPFDIPL